MFLRAQPEQTEVLSLEEEYDAEIRVGGRIRRLTGNLDRVDWREQEDPEGAIDEGAVILDYKTGRIKALRPDIWADDAFWDALDPEKAAEAASEPDPEHDFLPIMHSLVHGCNHRIRPQFAQYAYPLINLCRNHLDLAMLI